MKMSERKQEIIAVSAKLFKEKGYNAVSMRDIAKSLDIKAASLYNHITSKQEILDLIIMGLAEEFTVEMEQISKGEGSAIEKLERLIDLHIDITIRNTHAMACLNNDWMHLPQDKLASFVKMREEYEENFRSIVKKGMAKNEIRELNVEVILFSILSTLRTLHLWYARKKTLGVDTLKQSMRQVLLKGISA